MKEELEIDLRKVLDQSHTLQCMCKLLHEVHDPFARNTYPAHFTASAFIVDPVEKKALLTLHAKLKLYLQLGGHIDRGETPFEAAYREGLEESGFTHLDPVHKIPLDIDIHLIPQTAKEPEHYHYDICYLFFASIHTPLALSNESLDLRWFSDKEIHSPTMNERVKRLMKKSGHYF